MEEIIKSWNTRGFTDSYPYLLAAEVSLTRFYSGNEQVLLLILGIQDNGYTKVLGYFLTKGENKKDSYLRFLSNLYDRGIRTPLLWTGPDSSEFSEAIMEVYRNSDLQHCVRQKISSTINMVDDIDQDLFQYGLANVFRQKELGLFLLEMSRFRVQWQNKYLAITDSLEENMTFLMTFFKYPHLIHPYIKSSSLLHILVRQVIAKVRADPYSVKDMDIWLTALCRQRNQVIGTHPLEVFSRITQESSALYSDKYQNFNLRYFSGITR